MITRADKEQEIKAITDSFSRAKAAFLVDFKGMTVEQVTTLRKKLYPLESEMRVVRNTLALRALQTQPKTEAALKDGFVGTNAVVFAYGEATATAKALSDFSKEVESMQIKMGALDGSKLDAKGVQALANLPSKEVLRATLLGVMQAPMAKFVRTLNEVPTGLVRVLAAKRDQAS